MNDTAFALRPISAQEAEVLRETGGKTYVADQHPGYPCRQCLRDAAIGEELILVSHDPFAKNSPYRSAGPIFLHRAPCAPAAATDDLPTQLTCRQLSVRSFNSDEMMIDAAVVDGEHLRDTIRTFFDADESDMIHVHNAGRGCWAVTIGRS